MNGAPLPPRHGSPVRLIVPGWYGMAHVKWRYAWRSWTADWTATPDEAGAQPVDAPWNMQGMADNMVQRLPVTVR